MTRRSLFSALLIVGVMSAVLVPGGDYKAQAAPPTDRTLVGHVPDVVNHGRAELIGHHNPSDTVSLAIGLSLRDQGQLEQTLQNLNDPASPKYHHFLSQEQANQLFNPSAAQEQQVVQWLQAHGLTVVNTYPNHLLVDAKGTAQQVEHLAHVTLNDYRANIHGKDRVFYAPSAEPTVDASVAAMVDAITGLDNVPRVHIESNGQAHNTTAYFPQDFANAYDVNPLWNAGYTGAGQHIGLTLWTVPPTDSTLQYFGSYTGASVPTTANGRLKIIPVDGGATTAVSPDGGEAGMDIEYSSGIAPAATIDYYEAPTDSTGNPTDQGLVDALNLAGSDGNNNRQISSSWGGCEASSASDPFTSTLEKIFAANAATGHNYFFSSGDNGSWCDPNLTGTGVDPYPDYPASSPHVTGVGGTAFKGAINGGYPGESSWAYCSTCNGGSPEGSGGGYSAIFSRPSWQTGSGLASNGMRGFPDIAADADPNTGAFVCYGGSSTCSQYGGTSLASPLWAGMLALTNQYLTAKGQQPTGYLAPTLNSMAATNPSYPAFHDVVAGTNGGYNAGPGWDPVTGWGSIDLYNFARDLTALGAQPTATSIATATPAPTIAAGRHSRLNSSPPSPSQAAISLSPGNRDSRLTPAPSKSGAATPTPTPVVSRRKR